MEDKESNGIAVAGFVFALVSLLFGWIPILGWLTWILGVIFSAVGWSKSSRIQGKGRGFAIAGLVISFVGLIIILFLASLVLALLGTVSL